MDEGFKTLENTYISSWRISNSQIPPHNPMGSLYSDNKGHGCNICKKLHHLNIQETAIQDAHEAKMVDIKHVPGHSNISDLMTKEFKGNKTFPKIEFQPLSVRDPGGCYVLCGIWKPRNSWVRSSSRCSVDSAQRIITMISTTRVGSNSKFFVLAETENSITTPLHLPVCGSVTSYSCVTF
jgi:hypothetical protein